MSGIISTVAKMRILKTYGPQDPALTLFEQLSDDPHSALFEFLHKWSQVASKPVVLFIDEIDSLVGDTLISVLRQLRSGYLERPSAFPQSICLIGVRDVKDYKIFSEEQQTIVLELKIYHSTQRTLEEGLEQTASICLDQLKLKKILPNGNHPNDSTFYL